MEDMDMRHSLLAELIDNMHGRLADKMFPPNPDMASEPAASGIPGSEAEKANSAVENPMPAGYTHGDDKGTEEGIPGQEMTDEELDEMMKGLTND